MPEASVTVVRSQASPYNSQPEPTPRRFVQRQLELRLATRRLSCKSR
jgi:hypothetical protein